MGEFTLPKLGPLNVAYSILIEELNLEVWF